MYSGFDRRVKVEEEVEWRWVWLRSNLGKAGVIDVSEMGKDVLYYTDEIFNSFFGFLPSKINKHNIQEKIYQCKRATKQTQNQNQLGCKQNKGMHVKIGRAHV